MILWAVFVAVVSWFLVFVVPKLPEIRARSERRHNQEIAAEQDFYCAKLGMGAGRAMYHQCILNLEDYRAEMERRIADENNPFL